MRIRVRFPVTVEMPADADGRTQTLKSQTVVVSHAGATLEMDRTIPVGMGLQVTPPFGGTLLAEVNGAWVDRATNRHHVSIRLIDPTSWTSPERLSVPGGAAHERVSLEVHPRLCQLLSEYATYLSEAAGAPLTIGQAAEKILERAFLSDVEFQDWFAAKIMEDLQSWEESSVRRGEQR